MATRSRPNLAPEAKRGMRSRIVWLVVLASFVSGLIPCILWTLGTQRQLESHFDAAGPLLLAGNAERLRSALESARTEVEEIRDRHLGGGPVGKAALESALGRSRQFSALLVFDRAGELRAMAGDGPVLAGLLELLDATSALDAELVTVMQRAQLRKEIGDVSGPTLRVLDTPGQAPIPVAGVPLYGASGDRVGALHGVLDRDTLAEVLHKEMLGIEVLAGVIGPEGRPVLRTESSEAEVSAAGGDDFLESLLALVSRDWSLRYEAPFEMFDWVVVVEAPVLQAYSPLAPVLGAALLLPPAAALVFALIALWSATLWVRPLWSLYANMRGVARDEGLEEVPPGRIGAELGSLIGAFNVTVQRLRQDREQAERNQRALREQNQAFQAQQKNLSKLTITDSLTQLANRRYFENQLSLEIKRLSRSRGGLSMLVVDVDDFKKLNDTLGHAAGDEFLKQIARILQETVRETDLVARYGGEEFVVVATNTDVAGAIVLAEKVRTAVAEASFIVDASMRPRKATISIGVAQFRGSQTDLFNSADAALYEAKSSGKNCVMAAPDGGGGAA